MTGFAEDMAGAQDEYKETAPASGPPIFSDGTHQAIITLARVEQNDFGWQWVVGLRGQDSNTKRPASIRKWTNLPPEDEEKAGYLKSDLERLGYDTSSDDWLVGVEPACVDERFIGLVVDIGVKTKQGQERDYTNVYFNRAHSKVDDVEAWLTSHAGATAVAEGSATGADFEGAPLPAEDDIPF